MLSRSFVNEHFSACISVLFVELLFSLLRKDCGLMESLLPWWDGKQADPRAVSGVSSSLRVFWPLCFCHSEWFPLHKFMLTTTNHLVLTVSGNSLQDYLLHLPRDQGEAKRPVFAWIFPFCPWKQGWCLLSSVLWNLTHQLKAFRQLRVASQWQGQLSQYSQWHLIRSHRSVTSNLFKDFLIWFFLI